MTTTIAPASQQAPTPPPTARKKTPLWRSRQAAVAYIFIAPYVIFFLVFRIVPSLFGAALSFGDWSLRGTFSFMGLDNYIRLFNDSLFWSALRVTGIYALIALPLTVGLSLLMASLVNRQMRGISIYRSIFFLPVITSPVLSGIVFIWIFSDGGPINSFLGIFGLNPGSWLQNSTLVLPALAIVSAWMNFGYNMLILLAGMLAIPHEYYEAAQVDGATSWQRFRCITVPLLKPALFFVLILETVKSFQTFDTIYVMTGGGPVRASYNLTFMIYDQGFGYFDFGYASAAGVVLLLITLTISLIQRRIVGGDNK